MSKGQKLPPRTGLNRWLFWLYEGYGKTPYVFRLCLLVFDVLTIAYFVLTTFISETYFVLHSLDYAIAAVIGLDFLARLYITRHKLIFWEDMTNWADLIVVVTMIAPLFTQNLTFLRVLRAVRIIRAFTVLRRMKSLSVYLKDHASIIDRVTNLLVFIFLMSALVFVFQKTENPSINNYLDALYFTVSSLTTTGYGDIVMVGQTGRVLSVIIMVLGLTLFIRLLRSLMRPGGKITHECDHCGLSRHDPDASHCKHCGHIIHIDTRGFEV